MAAPLRSVASTVQVPVALAKLEPVNETMAPRAAKFGVSVIEGAARAGGN